MRENEKGRKKNEIVCSVFMIKIDCQNASLFSCLVLHLPNSESLLSVAIFPLTALHRKQENRNFMKKAMHLANLAKSTSIDVFEEP